MCFYQPCCVVFFPLQLPFCAASVPGNHSLFVARHFPLYLLTRSASYCCHGVTENISSLLQCMWPDQLISWPLADVDQVIRSRNLRVMSLPTPCCMFSTLTHSGSCTERPVLCAEPSSHLPPCLWPSSSPPTLLSSSSHGLNMHFPGQQPGIFLSPTCRTVFLFLLIS